MSRYIDADRIDWRLIIPTNVTIAEENMIHLAKKLVERQPTDDVVEVVHGEWQRHYSRQNVYADLFWHCSICGYKNDEQFANKYHNYCPHCGAKMDLKGNE